MSFRLRLRLLRASFSWNPASWRRTYREMREELKSIQREVERGFYLGWDGSD